LKNTVLIILLAFAPWAAQAGTNSLLSLEEPLSARPTGMGGAFVAVADDASTIFYNPAGLDLLKASEVTAIYKHETMDLSFAGLSAGIHTGAGSFGLALTDFDGGNLDVKELDGTETQIKAQQDIAADFSYGFHLYPQILLGAGMKYVRSSLAGLEGQCMAFDLGTLLWMPFPGPGDGRLSLGVSLLNFGQGIVYETQVNPLPQLMKFGAAYGFAFSPVHQFQLSVQGSLEKNRDTDYSVGAEYLNNFFVWRLGYGEGNYSFGLGLKVASHQLDYSFTPQFDAALQSVSYTYHFQP
jgi:hypothetical protein